MPSRRHAGIEVESWWHAVTFVNECLAGDGRDTARFRDNHRLPNQETTEHIRIMPMNVTNPFANLIRGVEADVLLELCSEQHFQTATAIARNCGRSRSEVRVVLNYYSATEIVDVFQDGGYKFYKLNPRHPIYAEVLKLSKSFVLRDLPRTAHALDAVDERAL
ncbi:MAG: hypothetical protein RLZ67_1066 [Actinomycetota bacterium]